MEDPYALTCYERDMRGSLGPRGAAAGRGIGSSSPGLSPVPPRYDGEQIGEARWQSVALSLDGLRETISPGSTSRSPTSRRPPAPMRSNANSSSGGGSGGRAAASSRRWVDRNETLRKMMEDGKLNERGELKAVQGRAEKRAFEQGSVFVKAAEEAAGGGEAAFQQQLFLKDVPLFRSLSELERFEIVSKCHVEERDDRETFVEQGQKLVDTELAHADGKYGARMRRAADGGLEAACAYLYVIQEGTVELDPPTRHQKEKSKKELFGELGLLSTDYTVHPTTVRAKGFCRVLRIPFDALKPMMRKHDTIKPELEAATAEWRQAGSLNKFKAMLTEKAITPEEFAMLEAGWRAKQERALEAAAKIKAEKAKFRYGKIEFAETGRTIPYLIIPNTAEGRDPMNIVMNMIRHFKMDGKRLQKPSIAFRVRAGGVSYLEWAEEVYANDFLAERWGWKRAWERGHGPATPSTDDLRAELQQLSMADLELRRDQARLVASGKDPSAVKVVGQGRSSRFATMDTTGRSSTHTRFKESPAHGAAGGRGDHSAGVGRYAQVPTFDPKLGRSISDGGTVTGTGWECQVCMRNNENEAYECATCKRTRGHMPTPRRDESKTSRKASSAKKEHSFAYTPQKQRRNRLYAALKASDEKDALREEMIAEIVALELKEREKHSDLRRMQWNGGTADEAKWGRQIYSTRKVDEVSCGGKSVSKNLCPVVLNKPSC
jgi:CRP-like cAMP-binding protein